MAWKSKYTAAGDRAQAVYNQFYLFPGIAGNVFFVYSGATGTGDGVSPANACTTINAAVALCAADNHDTILVLPGHTETITAAAGVALSTAGVRVVGVGAGRQRPRVNYTTAVGASFDVTAARCSVENLYFTPLGVDNVTAAVNVQAADFTIRNCEFELANVTNQAALGVLTTAAADRLVIDGCHFHGTTDAGTATAIRIVGGTDARIENNVIVGAYTTSLGGIDQNTTTAVNTVVRNNVISNQTASSTKALVFSSSSTPLIVDNRLTILSGTAPITAAAGFVGGNYYVAAAGVTAGTLI